MTPERVKRTEYAVRLSHRDRYRHLHVKTGGQITFFRIQLETKVEGKWLAVVRYDTSHGFAHRDLLTPGGNAEKTPIFNQDIDDALTFAENDLKTNWRSYRKRFLEEL